MKRTKSNPLTMDALATLLGDELLATPDDRIDEVLQELGLHPEDAVREVDTAFKVAAKNRALAILANARLIRDREVAVLKSRTNVEMTHDELRRCVMRRMVAIPEAQRTVLHRDFKEDSVEDLQSLLRQLDALEKLNGAVKDG
jgi:hypothetical protein